MFFSNLYFPVNKYISYDNEILSYNLMIKSNLICKLSSGIYAWLPLGLIILKKIENIIRKEMEAIGYMELFMPVLQSADLWKVTGRWNKFGNELFKLIDRNNRNFCLGPTHEELITSIFKNRINSYKDLPLKFYQIQTKFRDEIRPRYGVIRAKEFLMKDAYSFHSSKECFNKSYQDMYNAYVNILNKLCLDFNVVLADAGKISSFKSQEFHIPSNCGEDKIVYSSGKKYFASFDLAERMPEDFQLEFNKDLKEMCLVDTPNIKTIKSVASFFKVDRKNILKTILVKGNNNSNIVAILIRGDHEINPLKLEKINFIKKPFELVDENIVLELFGCPSGFLGPIKMENVHIIADYDVLNMKNFICGSNIIDKHYKNVNWEVNFPKPTNLYDIRYVLEGDKSPLGDGKLIFKKSIEVGHIFELGDKYTCNMSVNYSDLNGKKQNVLMGCYGIGVSRLVAAIIEQFNDKDGILWPSSVAPYNVVIVPVGYKKFPVVKEFALNIYKKFLLKNIDCLYYDKYDRLSIVFKNIDLIGITHRIVVNIDTINNKKFEYKNRFSKKIEYLSEEEVFNVII